MKAKSNLANLLILLILIGIFSLFITGIAFGGSWKWDNPFPTGEDLRDTWMSSGGEVFTVGENGSILHYNGSVWSSMKSGTTETLRGVWGS